MVFFSRRTVNSSSSSLIRDCSSTYICECRVPIRHRPFHSVTNCFQLISISASRAASSRSIVASVHFAPFYSKYFSTYQARFPFAAQTLARHDFFSHPPLTVHPSHPPPLELWLPPPPSPRPPSAGKTQRATVHLS